MSGPTHRRREARALLAALALPAAWAWEGHYVCFSDQECEPIRTTKFEAMAQYSGNMRNGALDERLIGVMTALFKGRKSAGRRATILTIGANQLKEDLELYKIYASFSPRFVFAEPYTEAFNGLNETVREFYGKRADNPDLLHLVHSAVCAVDDAHAAFYVDTWPCKEGSFGPAVTGCNSVLNKPPDADSSGRYIKTEVRCMTPPSLLKEASVEASDIDIVHLDTEGSDYIILKQLLTIGGFNPTILVFEWISNRGDANRMIDALHKMGYDIFSQGVDLWALANPTKSEL